jgi:hypothetical protein
MCRLLQPVKCMFVAASQKPVAPLNKQTEVELATDDHHDLHTMMCSS